MVTITRNTMSDLLTRLLVHGAPVLPTAVVEVDSWAGGTLLVKVRTVEPLKGRQGLTGYVVDKETGLDIRDADGRRKRTWAYLSQVLRVTRPHR